MNTAEHSASATAAARPGPSDVVPIDSEREVRFAVVMYGGVSLAIYINGVAQELLKMARATAPRAEDDTSALLGPDDAELSGTAGIYRKLGQYLGSRADLAKHAMSAEDGRPQPPNQDPIRVRFVVDVISGTSAGGINGVFLSKALARNQNMENLKRLWLQEGDLAKLLNDTKAADYSTELGFAVQRPEKSLLNSQRMYRKLLEALDGMEEPRPPDESARKKAEEKLSPLVQELDLFITTTDIEGIPLPIQLADRVVYERRYRNVFHFRYAPDARSSKLREKWKSEFGKSDFTRDDFKKANDPFLAFAARCTSSFPFAFDAMQLNDISPVLERYDEDCYRATDPKDGAARWDLFFKDYLQLALFDISKKARGEEPTGLPEGGNIDNALNELRCAFRSRSFGDGGYLDNKPFSYATSLLTRRYAETVVERKLLYVEPTPEHPELAPKDPRPRPDFAENVRAAVLDLPRQETIREDIGRVYERNQMLDRIATFANNVDNDIGAVEQRPALSHEKFGQADVAEMIGIYGVTYGSYHRLKIEEITALLVEIIARALGHDPDSDAVAAIRALVREWRWRTYSERKTEAPRATENEFLLNFDIRYTLRRLSFLNRRVNKLAQTETDELDDRTREILSSWLKHFSKSPTGSNQIKARRAETAQALQRQLDPDAGGSLEQGWMARFRRELRRIKKELIADALAGARLAEEIFRDPKSKPAEDLRAAAEDFGLPWETMQTILSEKDEQKRRATLNAAFEDRETKLKRLVRIVQDILSKREFAHLRIATDEDVDLTRGDAAARIFLDHYYQSFVLYDLVTYPVQYGTDAGEASLVQIYRVSPEDAPSLINEHSPGESRSKLAGRAVMSFGAFLDRRWRKNDMLWGRLDGAERLISILLPEKDDKTDKLRQELIKQAHVAILTEDVTADDLEQISKVVSDALAYSVPGSDEATNLRDFVETLLRSKTLSGTMQSALRQCLEEPEDLWSYYKCKYEVDRHLDPENAVRLISRSTAIVGNMLHGLAERYQSKPGQRVSTWLSRIGAVFWSVIAVAVPQSVGNLFLRHWLSVLYVFDLIMIFAGVLLDANMKTFGWKALGVTVTINLVIAGLGYYMAGKKNWLSALRMLVALGLIGLLICGGIFVAQHFVALDRTGGLIVAFIVSVPVLLLVVAQELHYWRRSKPQRIAPGSAVGASNQ